MNNTIAGEFDRLNAAKLSLMERCEEYAGWTLPSIFPPAEVGSQDELQRDYQPLGAKATNHLANKLVFALFNPSRPFFRLDASDEYKVKLSDEGLEDNVLQEAFSAAEQKAINGMATRSIRRTLVMIMKQLIITGNALMYIPTDTDKNVQAYSLRDYVAKRDPSGHVMRIITRDKVAVSTLDEDVQQSLGEEYKPTDEVNLYTNIDFTVTTFTATQAVNHVSLDTQHSGVMKDSPWIPLTWSLPRGFDYGVGLVEEYAGAFTTVSILTESLVKAGVIAADMKFLVNPSGVTDYTALNQAQTGEYVPGRPDDVHALNLDKINDLQWVSAVVDSTSRDIATAFLLNSAITRDAERVTAEEIRRQAQELETSLGGVYSSLSDDLQEPLAYLLLDAIDLSVNGKDIIATVVTGMDSLQRDADADNMLMFLNDLSIMGQIPEIVAVRIDMDKLISKLGANRRVNSKEFMKSKEQLQQEQQAAQQAQQQPVQ